MNKFLSSILSVFFAAVLLIGCSQQETTPEQTDLGQTSEVETEETVVVTISQDKGVKVITEEEVAFEEGATLMDIMQDNFDIEATDAGFITSIEGIAQVESEEESKYWMYNVNDEMPTVGANEYELQSGDHITFDLQAME